MPAVGNVKVHSHKEPPQTAQMVLGMGVRWHQGVLYGVMFQL
jgi:hypothetical protein